MGKRYIGVINSNTPYISDPLEQDETVGSSAPQSFLSMCPFFRRALEVPFLKDVTKNVHEN